MNRKGIIIAGMALVAVAGVIWMVRRSRAGDAPTYRMAPVTLANVLQTVSATGTLTAVKTVQVGTQVSGQVAQILADFNDHVTKGQLLARIDPTLQQQAVNDAQAQLEKGQAQLLQAQQEYDRNKPLFTQQFISATEFGTVQVNLSVAQADLKSAQVTLDKAKQNLSYTNIYAPINGVVIERDVDVGQTVAASLSAPQLFLIAQDLSQMEILAAVDESDISSVRGGEQATFTVEAFPGHTFTGVVQQVRLQSKLADNVVSYTAVITLDNTGQQLLPGMTATVAFITGSATNVLTVPNSALRFRPTAEELAASGLAATADVADSSARRGRGGSDTNATGVAAPPTTPPTTPPASAGGANASRPRSAARSSSSSAGSAGSLWTVDAANKLARIAVRIGLSDGQRTQVSGTGLTAGMQVIIGSGAVGVVSTTPAAANPLAPAATGGRGRGP
ncbi:MAG: efflux RND transporter periplasmic adaptor subunit [Gemmatimonadaceae bacterium]